MTKYIASQEVITLGKSIDAMIDKVVSDEQDRIAQMFQDVIDEYRNENFTAEKTIKLIETYISRLKG